MILVPFGRKRERKPSAASSTLQFISGSVFIHHIQADVEGDQVILDLLNKHNFLGQMLTLIFGSEKFVF